MGSRKKPHLLIVDDDEDIRSQMKWALNDDYEVVEAGDRETAVEQLKKNGSAVVCLDLGLPPHPADVIEGFKTLDELLTLDPDVKVVVITGQGEREFALKAVGQGAYDFFSKPIDIEVLKVVLERACYVYDLEKDHQRLRRAWSPDTFEGMLGTSRAIDQVFTMVRKVARSDAPVLVVGESGTGKELAARAIHQRSRRSQGTVRSHQLRGDSRKPPRERTLRSRKGSLHRRAHPAPGAAGKRPGRDPVPRRDRGASAESPGQDAALPPGRADPASRRTPADGR